MYYVNDGVYGSFNCILFDHATVEPHPLKVKLNLLDIIDVLFVYRIIVVIQYIPVVYGAQLVTVWIKSVCHIFLIWVLVNGWFSMILERIPDLHILNLMVSKYLKYITTSTEKTGL